MQLQQGGPVNAIIAAHGEAMVLSRDGETDLPLVGKRLQGLTADMGGSARQQVFRVKIGTDELAASAWATKEPLRTDTLLLDGRTRTLIDVRPLVDRGVVQAFDLTVSG